MGILKFPLFSYSPSLPRHGVASLPHAWDRRRRRQKQKGDSSRGWLGDWGRKDCGAPASVATAAVASPRVDGRNGVRAWRAGER